MTLVVAERSEVAESEAWLLMDQILAECAWFIGRARKLAAAGRLAHSSAEEIIDHLLATGRAARDSDVHGNTLLH